MAETNDDDMIAIVGMAGRFPGAADLDAFWANLRDGVESIERFSDEELEEMGVDAETRQHPAFVPAGARVEGAELFDPGFWGYSPREASMMDPQQRVFLETAWEALEHASCDPERFEGMIGVYAGMGLSTYLLFNLAAQSGVSESDTLSKMLGNDKDFLCTRASYHMNLKGPSVSVQSGCSTSLVAVHLACDALLSYQCDVALAGGSTIAVPQRTGYLHVPGGTASPDGHCRAFDAAAAGTVFGSGAGVIALKRLEDAIADGDTIQAVVRGSAVNNDGASKVGFTAPSVEGQAEVIVRALGVAGVDAGTIGYVEAHGTGTELGDPMEVRALTRAFRHTTDAVASCAIGSVKTNVGHLDTAAGVASLIKTVLALQHGQIPPSLHFKEPNPQIDLDGSPFYVSDRLIDWPADGSPRRAGVSAFGFGGTNAHVVLEEAPAAEPGEHEPGPQILALSARTPAALERSTERLAERLAEGDEPPLADIALTTQVGRTLFEHRRAVVATDREDALRALRSPASAERIDRHDARQERPVALMLPGLGDQHPGMGRELYERAAAYREALDRCAETLRPHLGVDLRAVLYPEGGDARPEASHAPDLRAMVEGVGTGEPPLDESVAHPCLFAVEYALAQQWMAWGLRPSAIIGHSLGEYVAATLAGVFSLEDALRLVAARSRLADGLVEGGMLAVPLGPGELEPLLDPHVSVALMNGPALTVAAGPVEPIERLEARLRERGIACRRLRTRRAFHSPMMEPVVAPLTELVGGMTLSPPRTPFLSSTTGTWISSDQATDPQYWGRHTARPVRFADGLRELCEQPDRILLECGPGQSLSALAFERLEKEGKGAAAVVVPSLQGPYDRGRGDLDYLMRALAGVWSGGGTVDWEAVHAPNRPRRIPLPTYPFERERCWIGPPSHAPAPATTSRRSRPEEWFYRASWRTLAPAPPRDDDALAQGHWLLLADGLGVAAHVREAITRAGGSVSVAEPGPAFARLRPRHYQVNPAAQEDYGSLLSSVEADGDPVTHVMHLWSLEDEPDATGDVEEAKARGFYSLAFLARALSTMPGSDPVALWVVSSGIAAVESQDALVATKTLLLGPARCIPQEYDRVSVNCVDVPASEEDLSGLVDRLLDTVAESPSERVIAYRGRRRWVEAYEPLPLGDGARYPLPRRGVYLLTGGLGRVGMDLADHLATMGEARLVLLGRSSFPSQAEWDSWVALHGPDDPTSQRIRRLQALIARGAEVLVVSADVTDPVSMRSARQRIEERFGPVSVVVHGAGVAGPQAFMPLDELDRARCEAQFKASVHGCQVLDEVFGDAGADLFLLLSSMATVLGGLGLAAYTAVNVFRDAYAQDRWERSGARWLSVDYEEWLDDVAGAAFETSMTQYGVRSSEAASATWRLAERTAGGRVVLATGDLEARLDRWIRNPRAARRGPAGSGEERSARPALDNPYAAPQDDTERAIAEVWEELLGFEQVGRDDNFYSLGGHSLLATQILARVRAIFDVDLSILSLLGQPTVAGLAERTREAAAAEPRGDATPLRPIARDGGPLPLSYAQRRFWFLDQLAPGNPFYNVPDVVRVEGPLRLDILRRSVNEIVARHEALRTVFVDTGDEPAQVVQQRLELPVPLVDLRDVPAPERDGRVRELALEEARAPFDLTEGPLVRAGVLRTRDDEHVLLVTMHHSVSDAWSIGVFVKELSALYDAYSNDRPTPLPGLTVQYADFAVWQRERLAGPLLESLLEYWRGQLAGAPPLLELSPDGVRRPAEQSFEGASLPVDLPASLVERLRGIGNREESTLFITLLTAFACLLQRHTGETDVVIGSPIAGRTEPALEDLIGTFVNMVPLRARVDTEATFAQLLRRVRDVTHQAYEHQELPFELLVEALQPERNLQHNPIFQVVLALQNAPLPGLALGDLRLEQMAMPSTTAKFDLMLMLRETEEGATGMLEYATDLLDEETVATLAGHFEALLHEVARNPDRRIAEIPSLPPEERALVQGDWARGEALDVASASIPELLALQAARKPDHTALFDDGEADGRAVTFGDLERQSNRIAHRLQALGIGAESRVGICMERSAEAIVVLVGVLKAGAAYVPLDPAYPSARLRLMVEQAQIGLVLADDEGADLGVDERARVLSCRELRRSCADLADHPVASGVRDHGAAYVIFTSGSTGVPKGVVGLHGGMRNRLAWMWERFPFADDEIGAQKTSLNFLDSFWEIFGSLCQGVPVVVVPTAVAGDPPELIDALARHRVTRVVLVPSLLRALLDSAGDLAGALPTVRTWVSSGEALPVDLAGRFLAACPGRRLLNLYGASEVSADVTYHELGPDDVERGVVPLGRPIANTAIYLLDEAMTPVGVGIEGDLYVGGPSLGRGYFGRADLTADRFVPDPFAGGGERLYRTGDRARFRADGTIEFRGRRDQQVKVRGFRVELLEVEGALADVPGISDCSVAAHDDTLVAYYVVDSDDPVDADAIRGHMRSRLPDHMVPNAFVRLAELPRTPSGKTDRKALPRPAQVAERPSAPSVAPRTPTEEALAGLWSAVLGVDGIGAHDDFFAVGGQSLLATRLLARVREAFDVSLPLRRFFRDPTVAGLAEALREESSDADEVERRAAILLKVVAMSEDEVERMLDEGEGALDHG